MASTKEKAGSASRPPRRQLANAIRALAMDAVEAANSGHPGMPMGMADIAEVLWNEYLRHSPSNPRWFDRDRFVLSNGHGSMLLYALAHLTGYPLSLEELKNFRKFGYRTAGHPERDADIGIETTTGPLGQGLANAIGMALAEKLLASKFNFPGDEIVDHYTYVFLGDGCLMEGVSHEVCSLAGILGLGKLIAIYDDNGISIDGDTVGWFQDDTPKRFESYGWHVIGAVDGHNPQEIKSAIEGARTMHDRPSLICCKTIIGWGAPNKQGTAGTHGAPLGEEEVAATRKNIGWDHAPFVVPEPIKSIWDFRKRGKAFEAEWQERFERYRNKYPELAEEFLRRMERRLPSDWAKLAAECVHKIDAEGNDMATRKASVRALDMFAPHLPELIGGSADLTGSNNTFHSGSKVVTGDDARGNYVHFGVREFGMAAILNGLSLHGGFVPYGGTFLVFSDYARNGLRMAALMKIQTIFVLTHDSIGLGEDGPTHQPIEQIASLRAMPNMHLWRPADDVETAVAWQAAIERTDGPTSLILTRQGVPHLNRTSDQIESIRRGGYIYLTNDGDPELTFLATGSEVSPAVAAARLLIEQGRRVRVVSMPSVEVFEEQSVVYRDHVLPAAGKRLAIEAGASQSWWRYVAGRGDVIGIDRFGQSASAEVLFENYGFNVESILKVANILI